MKMGYLVEANEVNASVISFRKWFTSYEDAVDGTKAELKCAIEKVLPENDKEVLAEGIIKQAELSGSTVTINKICGVPELKVSIGCNKGETLATLWIDDAQIAWKAHRYYMTDTDTCNVHRSVNNTYAVICEDRMGLQFIGKYDNANDAMTCMKMDVQYLIDVLLNKPNRLVQVENPYTGTMAKVDNIPDESMSVRIDPSNKTARLKFGSFTFKWWIDVYDSIIG